MATLTVNSLSRDGFNLTDGDTAAAGGGDEFANTGQEYLYVDNQDGTDTDVTFVTQATADSQAIGDRVVTVPAGERMLIGPFPTNIYNDGNDRVQVTYEKVTSLTVAVVKSIDP